MTSFLFTTLPSNDLGLLTRSLPVASALARRGHRITYSSPARAPRRLIGEAGLVRGDRAELVKRAETVDDVYGRDVVRTAEPAVAGRPS